MKDVNGKEIKVGDTVKTLQHSGGFLPPAPATIGIVEETETRFLGKTFQIRFRADHRDFDQFILLDGNINEII